jgi:glutamate formiminotransferase / formiminotetrahydrofolate cyclodeaminase
MRKLIECVPNFSEGRDMSLIKKITDAIESVDGISLLDVDPGKATNRTVVTFVGEPEQVIEAAFLAIKKAAELIDMRKHKGEHPRFGATDVCPLVPVSNISMEETVMYARKLAERVGKELQIHVYCYENAAFEEKRRNLANCRAGEYEGLKEKIRKTEWKPDFGPLDFNAHAGATAIGARDFLVAINYNLNTTSTRRANAIAFDVREKGRVKREGDSLTGKILRDTDGNPLNEPGTLKGTKAIGWFIEEFGIAQVSMNITNISQTPLHIAFEEVCKSAQSRGLRVSGSEIVGLVPLKAMIDAGKYFLRKQKRSSGIAESEILKIAITSMGLDDLYEFKAKEKIIEYRIADEALSKLAGMTLRGFIEETASESPAPGGGSVSASVGAMGIALATMVANLSSHKRGWDDRWEEFSQWAEKGQVYMQELLYLIDEDTRAFNAIMDAFSLSKKSDEEKKLRNQAIQDATKYAIEIPYKVMQNACNSMEVIRAMADIGNPNSVSDAGVGALCALMSVKGAFLNVKINASGLKDKDFVNSVMDDAAALVEKAEKMEKEILELVEKKL